MSNFYKLFALLLFGSVSAFGQYMNLGGFNQKVGIGLNAGETPASPLTLKTPLIFSSVGLDHTNSSARVGTFISVTLNSNLTTRSTAFVRTHSNHALNFATNESDAQMTLSTAGLVGIGTTLPTLAGLVVDKNVGATNALFGSTTSGVAIESNWPGIGLNCYYNNGRYSIAPGYVGLLSLNMTNGNISLYTSLSTSAGSQAVSPSERLTIQPSGGVALGDNTLNAASGMAAMAFGNNCQATGNYSTAIGLVNTASGYGSTALGTHASTNGFGGAFVIGDNSPDAVGASAPYLTASASHQFTARFANGYRFFSNAAATLGVQLVSGGNAWSALSDSTKKERFLPLNPSSLLANIRTLKLGTWNYKGQRTERHYGPMAQDFFARFGQDGLGVIGCDTLINSHDFTAVTLSGVQALAIENEQLKAEIAELKREQSQTSARLEALERLVLVQPAPRTSAASRRK